MPPFVPTLATMSIARALALEPGDADALAGIACLRVHQVVKGYLDEARRFADRVMLFAIEKPSGLVFPGEELVRISTDLGTGSAGTGLFLHRIAAGGGIPYLDF